jgi:purine-nucleoside phosphorylase
MTTETRFAVVAGSGIDLLPLLDRVTHETPFAEIIGIPPATVTGHEGRFVHGFCGDTPLIVQCGRVHMYEGLTYETVVRPVDMLREYGVSHALFTNAAGGLRPEMRPGNVMAADRLWTVPCRLWPDRPEVLQPDWILPDCDFQGMYMWVHGPSYETKAEIAFLQQVEGGAVGMSTAPELKRCQDHGIRAASVSVITNNCCTPVHLTHEHVLETADHASAKLVALIRAKIAATTQVSPKT